MEGLDDVNELQWIGRLEEVVVGTKLVGLRHVFLAQSITTGNDLNWGCRRIHSRTCKPDCFGMLMSRRTRAGSGYGSGQ